MEIRIEEMVKAVLKKLDESEEIVEQNTEFEYHGTSLPELIASLLEEEAERCILQSSRVDIDEWEEFEADVEWEGPGHGRIPLPSDCLRIGFLRMSDWSRRIYEFMNPASETYALRFGEAWSGRKKSPAAALHPTVGGYELEFIGGNDPGAYVQRIGYIPRPGSAESDETLKIPRSLIAKVCDSTAEKVKKIAA